MIIRGSMRGGPNKMKSIVHFTMKNKTDDGGECLGCDKIYIMQLFLLSRANLS